MGALAPAHRERTSDAVPKVMEATPDAMVVIDASGRIVRVNTQAEKLFGYSQEELLGQKTDFLMPRRLRRSDVKQRVGRVAHPRVRPLGPDLEVLARQRDGTNVPVEVTLRFLDLDD